MEKVRRTGRARNRRNRQEKNGTLPNPPTGSSPSDPAHRRSLVRLGALATLLIAAAVVLNRLGGADAFFPSPETGAWTYVAIAAMVFGDAIFPVPPGETTLSRLVKPAFCPLPVISPI